MPENIFSNSSHTIHYSPCPNDNFIFYFLLKEEGFKSNLQNINTLNEICKKEKAEIIKVSYIQYLTNSKNYIALRAGGAFGINYGPILISKKDFIINENDKFIFASPGENTTAQFLMKMKYKNAQARYIQFNKIIQEIEKNNIDLGVIINESRFNFNNLKLQEDLGQFWYKITHLPLPLGVILIHKDLINKAEEINYKIQKSIKKAFLNREEVENNIIKYATEKEKDFISKHIDLYVNNYSLDINKDGEMAVKYMLEELKRQKSLISIKDINHIFYK